MNKTPAFAAFSPDTPLGPHTIDRRNPGPDDVQIDILFCGVCHSDLHTVKAEWGGPTYPAVVGHEIVGRVTGVGANVTGVKVGDMAGVGCMVDSCQACASCKDGLEQFCENGFTGTYNSPDKKSGGVTYGGYSTSIVVDRRFVLRIPGSMDPASTAPLLCAGITTYSPLRHWGVKKGSRVGVVGLGGLGHMAIKIAHAMGAHVTLFTTSPGKEADAHRLGADEVILTKGGIKATPKPMDVIIDTVSAAHDLNVYIALLARDGTLVLLGAPPTPHPPLKVMPMISRRRSLGASLIGGIKETQEMLDFCAEHGIAADIELISMQEINTAYERMLKSDVKYRFVIDMQSLREKGS
ncbi:MAG TPA: NAD(P)-dependent alcohol dehydrogenase [Gemmatimonadales bacterium]|jgi:uncharacterized zinc-type alcohol dehydrogenase-like protein